MQITDAGGEGEYGSPMKSAWQVEQPRSAALSGSILPSLAPLQTWEKHGIGSVRRRKARRLFEGLPHSVSAAKMGTPDN